MTTTLINTSLQTLGGGRHKTNLLPLNAHWTLREGRGGGVQGVARVVDVKEKRILFRKIRGEVGE